MSSFYSADGGPCENCGQAFLAHTWEEPHDCPSGASSSRPAGNRPWVTVDASGVPHVHIPLRRGGSMSYPMTVDGAIEFAAELQGKLGELARNPDMQKRLGAKAVGLIVDFFTKGKGQ